MKNTKQKIKNFDLVDSLQDCIKNEGMVEPLEFQLISTTGRIVHGEFKEGRLQTVRCGAVQESDRNGSLFVRDANKKDKRIAIKKGTEVVIMGKVI